MRTGFHSIRSGPGSSSPTGTIGSRKLELRDGRYVVSVAGRTGGVHCTEFSRNGRRVATASDDFSIKVWELAGGDLPEAPKHPKKIKPAILKVGD